MASNLSVDPKSIGDLLSNNKSDFLIPAYQRPYAWEQEECETLWNDLCSFSFPDGNFDKKSEYYLGSIVTFRNKQDKLEIIDGQQRLTTLMLLLRAFYESFEKMQDSEISELKAKIEKCIWKTDELDKINKDELKIDSEVASENNKMEFLDILKTGKADEKSKSNYAKNYIFFQRKFEEFRREVYQFALLPARILNYCILLPIEAENQDSALRIFNTLNNRGKPLADADIFKSKFYEFYSDPEKRKKFISDWKELEELAEKNLSPSNGATPMDELFTRYMYCVRSYTKDAKKTTVEALRKFYEGKNEDYSLLKNENTLNDLKILSEFWDDIEKLDNTIFSNEVLRQIFILHYAPNGMWTYFTSVYFMKNKFFDSNKDKWVLDNEKFNDFLKLTTAFIFVYALKRPGVNALRTPVFEEMANIAEGKFPTFERFKFTKEELKKLFEGYEFTNGRPITKSILAWWFLQQDNQDLPALSEKFEIEHIYARKRLEFRKDITNKKNIELLGNKALLEKTVNITASAYMLKDKAEYYFGRAKTRGNKQRETINIELKGIATNKEDFCENDIVERNNKILEKFYSFVENAGLVNA